jgi:hypothetical protein
LENNFDPVLQRWVAQLRAEQMPLSEIARLRAELRQLGVMRGITRYHPRALYWRARNMGSRILLWLWRMRWVFIIGFLVLAAGYIVIRFGPLLIRAVSAIVDALADLLRMVP